MVTVRYFALFLLFGLLALSPRTGRSESSRSDPATGSGASLFAQSARKALDGDFPNREISFLLLDARSGRVLASRWNDPDVPIPLGSLVKPITALAYGERHEFKYPDHICRGAATGCWLRGGHGAVDLTSAIAYSCNSYFRMLTAGLTGAEVAPTAIRLGLDAPTPGVSGLALAGLGNQWLISPLRLARAYLEVVRRRHQPGVRQIVAGMAESARRGTGAEVDRVLPYPGALVKTGTARCTHVPRAAGDGFAMVLMPADQPQVLLMVRVHGVPGARAAKTAGQMLRRIEE